MPRKRIRDRLLQVWISASMDAELEEFARTHETDKSDMTRRALRLMLDMSAARERPAEPAERDKPVLIPNFAKRENWQETQSGWQYFVLYSSRSEAARQAQKASAILDIPVDVAVDVVNKTGEYVLFSLHNPLSRTTRPDFDPL